MKRFHVVRRLGATFLALAATAVSPQLTFAVEMSPYVSTPSQWGTGSGFYLGHTVSARTRYNNLTAGGSYTAQCNHPATLPVTGERTLSSSTLGLEPNVLWVTIPAQLPAVRNLTGWAKIPGDTYLACNYRWTAMATESGYSIGVGGISFQIGNGTMRDGGTVDFEMYRPPKEDADGGCIP